MESHALKPATGLSRTLRTMTGIVVWSAVLLSALSIHRLPFFDGHTSCGPWGCGPPDNALLAIHTSWIILIWPALFIVARKVPVIGRHRRLTGLLVSVIGLVGVAIICEYQRRTWLMDVPETVRKYFWQRCVFSTATATEWPVLQCVFGGLILSLKKSRAQESESTTSQLNPTNEASTDEVSTDEVSTDEVSTGEV